MLNINKGVLLDRTRKNGKIQGYGRSWLPDKRDNTGVTKKQ